jgi:hypothetical protein
MRPAPEHEHDAVEEDRVREQHRTLAHVEPRRHAAHAGHERRRDVADCSGARRGAHGYGGYSSVRLQRRVCGGRGRGLRGKGSEEEGRKEGGSAHISR